MPTTPTSIVNRLMGAEAFTDPLSLPSGTTLGGSTVDPANSLVTVAAATTTLTVTQALHAGKVILLASTGGLAVTPPAATGSGAWYRFFVVTTISGGSVAIDAKAGNATDIVAGLNFQMKVGTGLSVYAAGATDNLITIDGSTKGGVKGDFLEMVDMALHVWMVRYISQATGTVVTPFSSH